MSIATVKARLEAGSHPWSTQVGFDALKDHAIDDLQKLTEVAEAAKAIIGYVPGAKRLKEALKALEDSP